MGSVREKLSDLKLYSIWFDNRVSLRFKIANWLLRDELRWCLVCIKHDVDGIDRYNVAYDENDVRIVKDKTTKFYTERAMRRIEELWDA